MKHTQLKYDILNAVNSNDNPIAKDGFYDECQIAEFTGCWDEEDNYYEVLFYNNESYCIDRDGNQCEIPETDNWAEENQTFIYYDENSDKYFEQHQNGNFWFEVTKPILIPAF